MPATAILLPLAETVGLGTLGVTAGGIGAAATGLEASTLVASTVGGALIGAGEGAINSAIQGGDIAKGALTGGVGGGVGAGVTTELTGALGGGQVSPTASPDYPGSAMAPPTPSIAGSPTAALTAIGAASQGASGTASALAGGAPLETALQSGLRSSALGGISGLATGLAKYDFGADAGTAGEIGTAAKSLAGYALPSTSGASTPSYTPPVQPGLSLQGPTTAAPSPTLGQSLSIAPTLGYTPTGAVFGSSDTESPKQNVWNVGSLRNIGSAES